VCPRSSRAIRERIRAVEDKLAVVEAALHQQAEQPFPRSGRA